MFFYYSLSVNVLSAFLMFYDKLRAIKQERRIPEFVFFVLSSLGGFIGIWIGTFLFKHKTKKVSFQLKVALGFLIFMIIQAGLFS